MCALRHHQRCSELSSHVWIYASIHFIYSIHSNAIFIFLHIVITLEIKCLVSLVDEIKMYCNIPIILDLSFFDVYYLWYKLFFRFPKIVFVSTIAIFSSQRYSMCLCVSIAICWEIFFPEVHYNWKVLKVHSLIHTFWSWFGIDKFTKF